MSGTGATNCKVCSTGWEEDGSRTDPKAGRAQFFMLRYDNGITNAGGVNRHRRGIAKFRND